MALPINIHELVHGNTIEWERLEFKEGWNPEDVIHSMCAFANDLHNWGGGYIIIGIEERDGRGVLPPAGLEIGALDKLQGEIVRLGNTIQPIYFPICQPYEIEGKHILVLWCPAGDNRPYTAPVTLAKGAIRQSFVRLGSRTVIAKADVARSLMELAARIPFDDRVNNQAEISDLDLGLIQAYLQEVKSDLLEDSIRLPFADLCRSLLIAKGPKEDLRPVNVGLLFFCKEPERFFARAWIELVWHANTSGREFKEVVFKGPIHKQLRDAFTFFRTNIIKETVVKHKDKAEAERFYNYPYEAIEEALANAVYHKSYEYGAPIEVQVFPDRITILSHPGPLPPVDGTALATQRQVIAREYRNRRIGDFLKELHLTEARATGLPTIYDSLSANGSPKAAIETDDDSFFLVTIFAHSVWASRALVQNSSIRLRGIDDVISLVVDEFEDSTLASSQARTIVEQEVHHRVVDILKATDGWIKREELLETLGLSNQTYNRKKYLDPLITIGWIELEYPITKSSPKQRYKISEAGRRLLQLLSYGG